MAGKGIKQIYVECRRVLRVTKKPNGDEYQNLTKVTGIGILVIGAIGFILTLALQLIGPMIRALF